jgi:hypothetical protein
MHMPYTLTHLLLHTIGLHLLENLFFCGKTKLHCLPDAIASAEDTETAVGPFLASASE